MLLIAKYCDLSVSRRSIIICLIIDIIYLPQPSAITDSTLNQLRCKFTRAAFHSVISTGSISVNEQVEQVVFFWFDPPVTVLLMENWEWK